MGVNKYVPDNGVGGDYSGITGGPFSILFGMRLVGLKGLVRITTARAATDDVRVVRVGWYIFSDVDGSGVCKFDETNGPCDSFVITVLDWVFRRADYLVFRVGHSMFKDGAIICEAKEVAIDREMAIVASFSSGTIRFNPIATWVVRRRGRHVFTVVRRCAELGYGCNAYVRGKGGRLPIVWDDKRG